jgi:maltose O-acetyltransferase
MVESRPVSEAAQAPVRNASAGSAPRATLWQRLRSAVRRDLSAFHLRLTVVDVLVRFLPHLSFSSIRWCLYRSGGIAIGRKTVIAGRLQLIGFGPIHRRLRIGSYCYFTTPLFADLSADITIGNHVTIGHHVVLITADHVIGSPERRAGELRPRPVVIEDGAWIAARVTVLPGARIGAGAVVGAGSLVKGEIPPHVLAAGIPARVIRRLDAPGSAPERWGPGEAAPPGGSDRG